MAFSFKRRESLRAGFCRIADHQLDMVLGDLSQLPDPGAVHDARKRCKMLRGLLRLVGSGFPKSWCQTEIRRFRKIATALGGARDADVRLATFKHLITGPAAPLRETTEKLHAFLESDSAAHRKHMVSARTIRRVTTSAEESRMRFAEMKPSKSGWRLVGPGLEQSYHRARTAFQHARAEPSVESHHEWRKRVKDLWYHLQLLRELDPRYLRPRIAQLESISDLLGDEHDLIVLRTHLAALPVPLLDRKPAAQLEAIIALRCHDLFAVASKIGTMLLNDEPAQFVAALQKRWKKWRR